MSEDKYGVVPCYSACGEKKIHMHLKVPLCPFDGTIRSKTEGVHILAFLCEMGLNPEILEVIREEIACSNLPETCESDEATKNFLFPNIHELYKKLTGEKLE